MATYPVHLPRKSYRGPDPAMRRKISDHNEVVADLEKYINSKVKADIEKYGGPSFAEFFYGYMADETGYSEDTIEDICFGIDCGRHGFMVHFTGKECGTSRRIWGFVLIRNRFDPTQTLARQAYPCGVSLGSIHTKRLPGDVTRFVREFCELLNSESRRTRGTWVLGAE